MTNKTLSPADMLSLSMQGWKIWTDASMVIAMRLWRIAQGGRLAEREAARMVDEKIMANMMLGWALWPALVSDAPSSTLARKTMQHYGSRVSANKRRLSKGK